MSKRIQKQEIFDLIDQAIGMIKDGQEQITAVSPKTKSGSYDYVNKERIEELKQIGDSKYDLKKLIRFCEELNIDFKNKCYLSTIMVLRAILNHVPPIFNQKNFTEVISNYGGKSFKESMKFLEESSRKIADGVCHEVIRGKEVLPNETQVDFSNNLDQLLAEIYRILGIKDSE